MGPHELVLVRHGESEGNAARARAWELDAETIDIDVPDPEVVLTDLGRRQAATLPGVLRVGDADKVWSSPYVRARETAGIAVGAVPIRVDERLRDRELGILDRLTGRGISARYPEEADRRRYLGKFWYRPPGGESWADVALRLRSWLGELDDGRHVVFAHDAVIVLVRYVLERLDDRQALELSRENPLSNASVTVLRRDAIGRWSAAAHGDRAHLGELDTEHPADPDPRLEPTS